MYSLIHFYKHILLVYSHLSQLARAHQVEHSSSKLIVGSTACHLWLCMSHEYLDKSCATSTGAVAPDPFW